MNFVHDAKKMALMSRIVNEEIERAQAKINEGGTLLERIALRDDKILLFKIESEIKDILAKLKQEASTS